MDDLAASSATNVRHGNPLRHPRRRRLLLSAYCILFGTYTIATVLNIFFSVRCSCVYGCSCIWQRRDEFDGLGSLLCIICGLFTALLTSAAFLNVCGQLPPQHSTVSSSVTTAADEIAAGETTASPALRNGEEAMMRGSASRDKLRITLLASVPPPAAGTPTTMCHAGLKLSAAVTCICSATLIALSAIPGAYHDAERCSQSTSALTRRDGGVSPGLTQCIARFHAAQMAGHDPYLATLDSPLPAFALGVSARPVNISMHWSSRVATAEAPHWKYPTVLPAVNGGYHAVFNRAEWVLPPGYSPPRSDQKEARVVFVHGCNALCSSLGPYCECLMAPIRTPRFLTSKPAYMEAMHCRC